MKNTNSILVVALCALLGSLAAGCGAKLNENTEGQLKSALEAQREAFKACYEAALERDRNTQGPMNLVLDVHKESGKVTKAEVKITTISDEEMKKCVAGAAKQIKLPEPPGVPVEGHYAVAFGFEK
jgi:hypothetical protein